MAQTEEHTCPACRTQRRSEEDSPRLIHRLNLIEGQIGGIRRMVEEDRYCPDILLQAAAANAALAAFNRELLAAHLRTCVTQDIREGREDTMEELIGVLQKLMKG